MQHVLLLLTGQHRTLRLNAVLGGLLAFNAGAINAGGFLLVQMYTSHMTGFVAMLVDNLVLGQLTLVLAAVAAILFFAGGAATTALLVHAARRHRLRSEYALPLAIEALLMLAFGLLGGLLVGRQTPFALPLVVPLLAFSMGLQNALMSEASSSLIRTTHMTGVITDLGIELGKVLYWNRSRLAGQQVVANRVRLRLLLWLLAMFVFGGLYGAAGFQYVGFVTVLPLALLLLALSLPPLAADLRRGGLLALWPSLPRGAVGVPPAQEPASRAAPAPPITKPTRHDADPPFR